MSEPTTFSESYYPATLEQTYNKRNDVCDVLAGHAKKHSELSLKINNVEPTGIEWLNAIEAEPYCLSIDDCKPLRTSSTESSIKSTNSKKSHHLSSPNSEIKEDHAFYSSVLTNYGDLIKNAVQKDGKKGDNTNDKNDMLTLHIEGTPLTKHLNKNDLTINVAEEPNLFRAVLKELRRCVRPEMISISDIRKNRTAPLEHIKNNSNPVDISKYSRLLKSFNGFLSLTPSAGDSPITIPDVLVIHDFLNKRLQFYDSFGNLINIAASNRASFFTDDGIFVPLGRNRYLTGETTTITKEDGGITVPNCSIMIFSLSGSLIDTMYGATVEIDPFGGIHIQSDSDSGEFDHFSGIAVVRTSDGLAFNVGKQKTVLGRTLIRSKDKELLLLTSNGIQRIPTTEGQPSQIEQQDTQQSRVIHNVSVCLTDSSGRNKEYYRPLTAHISPNGKTTLIDHNGVAVPTTHHAICMTADGSYFCINKTQFISGSSIVSVLPSHQCLISPVTAATIQLNGVITRYTNSCVAKTSHPDGHVVVHDASSRSEIHSDGCIVLIGHDGTRILIGSDGSVLGRVLLRNKSGRLFTLGDITQTTGGIVFGTSVTFHSLNQAKKTIVNCLFVLLGNNKNETATVFDSSGESVVLEDGYTCISGNDGISLVLRPDNRLAGQELALPPNAVNAIASECSATVVDTEGCVHFYTAAVVSRHLEGRIDIYEDATHLRGNKTIKNFTVAVVTLSDNATVVIGSRGHVCCPVILPDYFGSPILLAPRTCYPVWSATPKKRCSFMTAAVVVLPSSTFLSDLTVVIDGEGIALVIASNGVAQRLPRGSYITTPWGVSLSIGDESKVTGEAIDIAFDRRTAVINECRAITLRSGTSLENYFNVTAIVSSDGHVSLQNIDSKDNIAIEDLTYLFGKDGTRFVIAAKGCLIGDTVVKIQDKLKNGICLVAIGSDHVISNLTDDTYVAKEEGVSSRAYDTNHVHCSKIDVTPNQSGAKGEVIPNQQTTPQKVAQALLSISSHNSNIRNNEKEEKSDTPGNAENKNVSSNKNANNSKNTFDPISSEGCQVQMLTGGITAVIRKGNQTTYHGSSVLLYNTGEAYVFSADGNHIEAGDISTTTFCDGTTLSLESNGHCITGSTISVSPRRGAAVLDDCKIATIQQNGQLLIHNHKTIRVTPEGCVEVHDKDGQLEKHLIKQGVAAAVAPDGTTITIGSDQKIIGRTLIADEIRRVFVMGAERPCCTTLLGPKLDSAMLGSIVASIPAGDVSIPLSLSLPQQQRLTFLGGTATIYGIKKEINIENYENQCGVVKLSGPDGGRPSVCSDCIITTPDGTLLTTETLAGRITSCGGHWKTRTKEGGGSLIIENATVISPLASPSLSKGAIIVSQQTNVTVVILEHGLVAKSSTSKNKHNDAKLTFPCLIKTKDNGIIRVGFDGYVVGRTLLLDGHHLRFIGQSQHYATTVWGLQTRSSTMHGCTIVTASNRVLHGATINISSTGQVVVFSLRGQIEYLLEGGYIAAADGTRAVVQEGSWLAGSNFTLTKANGLRAQCKRITLLHRCDTKCIVGGSVEALGSTVILRDSNGNIIESKREAAIIEPVGGPNFISGPDNMILGQLFLKPATGSVLYIWNSERTAVTYAYPGVLGCTTHIRKGVGVLSVTDYVGAHQYCTEILAVVIDGDDRLKLKRGEETHVHQASTDDLLSLQQKVVGVTLKDGTHILIGNDGLIKGKTLPGLPFLKRPNVPPHYSIMDTITSSEGESIGVNNKKYVCVKNDGRIDATKLRKNSWKPEIDASWRKPYLVGASLERGKQTVNNSFYLPPDNATKIRSLQQRNINGNQAVAPKIQQPRLPNQPTINRIVQPSMPATFLPRPPPPPVGSSMLWQFNSSPSKSIMPLKQENTPYYSVVKRPPANHQNIGGSYYRPIRPPVTETPVKPNSSTFYRTIASSAYDNQNKASQALIQPTSQNSGSVLWRSPPAAKSEERNWRLTPTSSESRTPIQTGELYTRKTNESPTKFLSPVKSDFLPNSNQGSQTNSAVDKNLDPTSRRAASLYRFPRVTPASSISQITPANQRFFTPPPTKSSKLYTEMLPTSSNSVPVTTTHVTGGGDVSSITKNNNNRQIPPRMPPVKRTAAAFKADRDAHVTGAHDFVFNNKDEKGVQNKALISPQPYYNNNSTELRTNVTQPVSFHEIKSPSPSPLLQLKQQHENAPSRVRYSPSTFT